MSPFGLQGPSDQEPQEFQTGSGQCSLFWAASGFWPIESAQHISKTRPCASQGGKHKLKQQCGLPLTGARVVNRCITEMGVFDFVTKVSRRVHVLWRPIDGQTYGRANPAKP